VIAINKEAYSTGSPSALAPVSARRRMRFMIKSEMQEVKAVNLLIKHQNDSG